MTREDANYYLKSSGFSDEQIDTIAKAYAEPCEDAISRQAVLDQTYLWSKDEFLRVTNPFNYLRKRINELPSVNPQEPKYCDRNICIQNEYNGIGCDKCEVTKSQEPKVEHWIIKDGKEQGYDIGGVKTWYIQIICSECGFIKTAIEGHTGQYNYCPNCGAKMIEPQESEEQDADSN